VTIQKLAKRINMKIIAPVFNKALKFFMEQLRNIIVIETREFFVNCNLFHYDKRLNELEGKEEVR